MKCNTCGIEDSEFAGKGEFLNHCRQCKKQAELESEPDIVEGNDTIDDTEPEVKQAEVQEISIPLSICPNVISYLPDNQLIKIIVVGRKQGDRFVVEETKYK